MNKKDINKELELGELYPFLKNLPEPFLSHQDAPVYDPIMMERYRRTWKSYGGSDAGLDLILDHVTIVTPELHRKTHDSIIKGILRLLKSDSLKQLNVITSGGRSGRYMSEILLRDADPKIQALRSIPQLNLNSLELSSQVGTGYIRAESDEVLLDPQGHFLYIDDWIISGQQIWERLDPIRQYRTEAGINSSAALFSVVVGGITTNGLDRVLKDFGALIDIDAVFRIPTINQLLNKEEYAFLMEELGAVLGFSSDIGNQPLTLEWERTPDNIPTFLSSLAGLRDPRSGETVYLFPMQAKK